MDYQIPEGCLTNVDLVTLNETVNTGCLTYRDLVTLNETVDLLLITFERVIRAANFVGR